MDDFLKFYLFSSEDDSESEILTFSSWKPEQHRRLLRLLQQHLQQLLQILVAGGDRRQQYAAQKLAKSPQLSVTTIGFSPILKEWVYFILCRQEKRGEQKGHTSCEVCPLVSAIQILYL